MRTKLLTKIVPVVLAGGGYSDIVLGYSPIAYWPLWEASGAAAEDISGNGFDGAYTGVTLGQDGIGDGNTCPLFDGANDFLDFYSAGFSSAFNGDLGSLAFWMKVFNAGVWEDGTTRILIKIGDGDASSINIYKRSDNNNIRWVYDPEGSYEFYTKTDASSTDWIHIAMTWNKAGDLVVYYWNGLPVSTDSGIANVWGDAPADGSCVFGAGSEVPASVWNGYLAHLAIWDSELSGDDIAILASV